jgi:hypothetical protein
MATARASRPPQIRGTGGRRAVILFAVALTDWCGVSNNSFDSLGGRGIH